MIPLNDPDVRRQRTPYVTYTLVTLNVVIWLYQALVLSDLNEWVFTLRLGVIPAELTQGLNLGLERLPTAEGSQLVDLSSPVPTWATMFTSMFLHGGFLHLAGNMVFLWVFGDNVEDRLGHVLFAVFYAATGAAAVWAQVAVDPESTVPMIGASGAIAGVLGGYLLFFPYSRVNTLFFMGIIFHARIAAIWLIGGWGLLQAFSGVGSLGASSAGSGVAYFAHLGGLAAGLAAIALYKMAHGEPVIQRRRRPPAQFFRG